MEYRVYTIALARYLTNKGFQILRTAQDVKKPEFMNWFFANTDELQKAIKQYTIDRNNYYLNRNK